MRDDLLDAQAAVDWAKTQIPAIQQRFLAWQRDNQYEFVVEHDPDTGEKLVAALDSVQLDRSFNVETGAIINGIRSSLDLLAAALAFRNGVKPSADTHFPVFRSDQEMIDPLTGIEGKKWLSKIEVAAIKALKPYAGGDPVIFPLHQLDVVRKHERLIVAAPVISAYHITAWGPGITYEWRRLKDKTILVRLPPGHPFTPTKGNTLLAAQIVIDEPTLGLSKQPVPPVLRRFAERAADIIRVFDT